MARQREINSLEVTLEQLLETESVDSAMDMYLAASQQLGRVFKAQIDYIRETCGQE